MRICVAVALVVSLVVVGTTGAQFYRYVDPQGYVRFTDDINQVPENQRSKIRSYAESQDPQRPDTESSASVSKATAQNPGLLEPPAPAPDTGLTDKDALEDAKLRIEEMKNKLDTDYQALLKEKEILAKEKAAHKTREEINDYNKRVEVFNQHAAKYDTQSGELRKMADEYNARIIEENSRAWTSGKKMAKP